MNERIMTITAAAKSFSKVVNGVQRHHDSTLILKRGKPVARIIPVAREINTTRKLAAAWPRLAHLTPDDAAQFERDITDARHSLPALKSAWD